jgi:hypothetical protein
MTVVDCLYGIPGGSRDERTTEGLIPSATVQIVTYRRSGMEAMRTVCTVYVAIMTSEIKRLGTVPDEKV